MEGSFSSLSNLDDSDSTKYLVRNLVQESFKKLKEEPVVSKRSIRWELGSSWAQHLQRQETSTDNNFRKNDGNEVEQTVKGLGKQFKLLKRTEKKVTSLNGTDLTEQNDYRPLNVNVFSDKVEPNSVDLGNFTELEKLLSNAAFLHLKESGTGLHSKVCDSF